MKKWCLRTLGTVMVLLLVLSGNAFAASENDSQTGMDAVTNLLGSTTSQAVGVSYHTHVQNLGWETNWVSNSITSGTYGQSLRLEGIEIKLTGDVPDGAKIEYRTQVQNQGWETYWANNGVTAGTMGMGLRLEGIQIRLVNMPDYSIEYRTHVQDVGWETNWAKDGETAGTQGRGLRLEGIQIRIIKEDADLTAYNRIIETTKKAVRTNYTTYSWDNLQSVIKSNVVTVKSTQDQVDTATKAIQAAYAGLESEATAKVYSSAGTYGPSGGLETISQDVVIKSDGITLQNMHITGDLIISEEVGQGNATLNNITVDGETYIRGGGKNSIHINGGNYKRITIQETASGKVRIVATNAKGLDVVIAEDAGGEDVILEGSFDTVQVNAPKMKVSTQGTTIIKEMTVSKAGAGSQVTLDSNSQVDSMVFNGKADVKGQGNIAKSKVNADNVTYEKAPGQQTVAPTVKIPPKTPVVKVPVTGITLSGAGNVTTLVKAGTLQITAAVTPSNVSNNKVIWSIVNGTGTASISNSGVVTGLTAGTVTVNATAQDGSGKIGTMTLTVTEVTAATIATVSTISSSTVNPTFTITLTNDTFTATANTISNWTNAMGATGLTVSSITRYSNNQVIINTTGTAAVGTISFKANAAALTKNLASNTITVTVNPVMVSSISVSGTGNATTVTKGSTLQMLATVLPVNAVNKNLTWSVVNGTGSATISTTGLLTPVTAGTVTVKATAVDGSAIVGPATITIQEISPGVIACATTLIKGTSPKSIVVTLTDDTFGTNAGSTTLWTIDPGTTGLTITGITRDSNTQAIITISGTALDGTLSIQAKAGALSKAVASNSVAITVGKINLTGVAITGNPTVDSTLTATLTPAAATATYQWQRASSATGAYSDISGATAATYKLVTDDEGKYIKVIATGSGSYAGVVPSSAVVGVNPATLSPATASFNKASQADVLITLTPNGKTITGINDGTKDLTLNTDYTVTGNVYTIKKEYLSGKTNATVTLTFKMSSGINPATAIAVSGTVPGDATVSPATANFDKSVPADVVLTLTPNGRIVTIIKDGSKDLLLNTDYSVVGNIYTIKKEYLTTKTNGPVTLTFNMSGGSYPTVAFTVSESDITPPIVSATAQTSTNGAGQSVKVQSNDAGGKVYIIKTGVAQSTVTEFETQVTTKNGAKANVTSAGTDIAVSTAELTSGTYYAYAVDAAGNISSKGTNGITVTAVDTTAPTVTATVQSATNASDQTVKAQSNEASGTVYIILDGETQSTVANLDTAVTGKKGAKASVTGATTDITVSTAGLSAGTYYAYAVDAAGNISIKGTNAITVTAEDTTAPTVTATLQSATNASDQTVKVQSNEVSGAVYIILDGETQSTVANLDTAVTGKKGAKASVTGATTDITISTAGLLAGTYYAYAVDAAGNISIKGTNAITVTAEDTTAPTVTATLQSATNASDQTVKVQSNEASGAVYIILDGETQSTVANLDTAVTGKKGAKASVTGATTDITVSTAGLSAGTYYAYAVDAAGNISIKGTNAITVTAAP